MIKVSVNNEELDIDVFSLVTFKKAQQLNGIQDIYSYSNNFNLKNSSKNRRLLGINYLPNSKAKSMTTGYDADVVFNGCIFLKKQNLKVQKETPDNIPAYLLFSDSFLVAKAKEILLNQIVTDANYIKDLTNFVNRNFATYGNTRVGPISAQESSGLIVVEEVPILIKVKYFILQIFTQMGYSYTGDILTDVNIEKYYMSSNVGVYGLNGVPQFDPTKTAYDFILDFLKTFNGYIEVSDSSKSLGLYFWKNIETIKDQFVDYTSEFVNFKEYTFEGGLAKINKMAYSDSPEFYNGFFNNNKSVLDKTDYLTSAFGAGPLRLFADADILEDGHIFSRPIGEKTDPQTINLFIFDLIQKPIDIFYGGTKYNYNLFGVTTPNILQIWQEFHQAYTINISLPTVGLFTFRYNAIFLSNFKMSEVFFIKNLSTYWLPLELNFSTKKDEVKIKSLMIEKSPVDIPVVFDFNVSVGFYEEVVINNIDLLYWIQNKYPAATLIITAADLTKNNIFVNGVQVLAFPTPINIFDSFEIQISNVETENIKSSSDIFFQFISEEGGVSRIAKINVAHNGRANFESEFRSETDTEYTFARSGVDNFGAILNYSVKVETAINIADTFAPLIGDVPNLAQALTDFKILKFDRSSTVNVDLLIGNMRLYCTNEGGSAEARTKIFFNIWKNGVLLMTVYSAGAIDSKKKSDTTIDFANVRASKSFNVLANDILVFGAQIEGTEESRPGSGHMGGSVTLKNVSWVFKVTEQL